eukprot:gene13397-14772_t
MADEDELEEVVRYYFLKNFECDTILNLLEKYHGIKISKRKLQDRLKRYALSQRTSQDNQIDEQRIRQYILLELDGPGRLLGYRALWRKLQLRYGITTPRSAVQTLLRIHAHRYGSSHSNQRIEAWWAFLHRSWSSWWMDLFKDVVDSGSIDLSNKLHCKCLWFCFSKIIQNELDSVRESWNSHYIRSSRYHTLSGIPDQLYFLPENVNAQDHIKVFNHDDLGEVRNELASHQENENHNDSDEYYLFFEMITGNLNMPEPLTWKDGLELYNRLISIAVG